MTLSWLSFLLIPHLFLRFTYSVLSLQLFRSARFANFSTRFSFFTAFHKVVLFCKYNIRRKWQVKKILSPKGNWSRLISANNRARKSPRISLSRQWRRERARAPLQHTKVIRSPEGSVNCFSRREAADGGGSKDPDAPAASLWVMCK